VKNIVSIHRDARDGNLDIATGVIQDLIGKASRRQRGCLCRVASPEPEPVRGTSRR